ncbi:uncharacterized protein LOC121620368 [Chelmon rostratus]|uniref:uncharacterized protein LOC121620368 n=1 Tax=Chelmon rostratus TaxID=109905 RepID=UPI001BEB5215|nr:uncharacterized protein LOC121620368 [Chelmon rostratus]
MAESIIAAGGEGLLRWSSTLVQPRCGVPPGFVLVFFQLLSVSLESTEGRCFAMKTLVFQTETSNSYVEMVPLKPLSLRAFTLCMRLATELSGKREVILFAYRTGDYDELNVWRELDGRLSFYMSGDGVLFRVPELGALQTHLCVTWDSSSGAAALFMDGRKSLTKIYRKNHSVRPGGKVILGQDPDVFLGNFEAKQSFVGEIGDVNMWDRVLSDSTIRDMFSGKRVPRGNVFDWETAQLRIYGRTLVFQAETSNSYVEMVPLKPLSLRAFTLCMRLATELSGEREVILFAYRTGDYDELNVWRELDGRLSFYMSGDGVFFRVPELGALQTHLCVTWDSSSGAAALFMDGRKSLTKIYRKNHSVRPGGKVILGQDPDVFLGDFEAKQSFVGEIGDVNMWDRVLSDNTIRDMFSGKRVPRGNVFDWETAQLKINGQVDVLHQEL